MTHYPALTHDKLQLVQRLHFLFFQDFSEPATAIDTNLLPPETCSTLVCSYVLKTTRIDFTGGEMKKVVQKVIAFIIRDGALAVFRQDDPGAGIQVPAGTLRAGEDPEAGALREAEEESGLSGLRVIRFLGRYQWDISPIREEIQDRHVYLLAVDGPVSERWEGCENHDGERDPTPFHFYWLPLGSSELDELAIGQGTFLDLVGDFSG